MRLSARSRTMIVTAAALTFVLAGSTIAFADDGRSDDRRDRRPDRLTDELVIHPEWPSDRISDRMHDRPKDRPTDRPTDRPADRPKDRPDRRAIWERCKKAAETDEVTDIPPELRKICHRMLWRHRAWKRCIHWAAEHTDIDVENRRELWKICHRLWWNQHHAQ